MRSCGAVDERKEPVMSAAYLGLAVFVACRTTWTLLFMTAVAAAGGTLSARRPGLSIAFHAAVTGALFGAAMW